MTASSAQAAPGDGTLVVDVVDQYGRPTVGSLKAYAASDGKIYYDSPPGEGPPPLSSTHIFTVPPGGYALQSLTGWSGIDCPGFADCITDVTPTTAVTAVTEDAVTHYTLHVTVPSIVGGRTLGAPLSVRLPKGLTDLLTALGSAGLGGGTPAVQWVRGTTGIPGATGTTYKPTPLDSKQRLTARLQPTPVQNFLFASYGAPPQPFTTNAITMPKFKPYKTKTKLKVAKNIKANERVSVKVKVKSKSGTPKGYVTLKIGKFKAKKKLKDGSFFISLPKLAPGKYKISTKYAGSDYFGKSKSKATVTVRA